MRIYKAVRILENRYLDPPSVNELAKQVGMSVSHFHKSFRVVIGETMARHCLRLRVERAAALLKYSSWPVGEIGGICGFETHASFSRGFKRFYGMTPKDYRHKELNLPFLKGRSSRKPGLTFEDKNIPTPEVITETWGKKEFICLRFYGPVREVYKPWQEFLTWASTASVCLDQARFFGLWFDSWEGISDDNYRYECAICLPEPLEQPLPRVFFRRELEQGVVARASVTGRIKRIEKAWYSFSTGWLPFSGFQPRGEFVMDEYPMDLLLGGSIKNLMRCILGDISISLCIPVQTESIEI